MKLDEMRLEDYEIGDRIVVSLNYGMGPEVIGTIIEKHEDIRDDGSNRPGVGRNVAWFTPSARFFMNCTRLVLPCGSRCESIIIFVRLLTVNRQTSSDRV